MDGRRLAGQADPMQHQEHRYRVTRLRPPFRRASPKPSINQVIERRRPQNGPDPRGQIPDLPDEVGHRHLRASTMLEEQLVPLAGPPAGSSPHKI